VGEGARAVQRACPRTALILLDATISLSVTARRLA
jgi:hypothetical protein